MTRYYDLILGLIPVALIGGTGVLTAAGLGLTAAVPIAATLCVGLIGHAMFVNAPVDSTQPSNAQPPNQSQRPPFNSAD